MVNRDRIAGLFFLLLGFAVTFYSVRELGLGSVKAPGPGFFPFMCGVCIVIFSAVWLYSLRTRSDKNRGPFWEKGEWIRPAMAVAITLAYAAIMDDLGFILATFLFIAAWQFAIEREKWSKNLIISSIGTAGMYAIFQVLLSVPLPRGLFI